MPGPGRGDQVAPDPAAEVDQRVRAERLVAAGPVGGDRQPGGLLERLRREVEAVGELAELGPRPLPELDLGQRDGDRGRRRRTTQLGLDVQLVAGAGQLGRPGEKRLPLIGEQPPERVEVHPVILTGSAMERAGLALVGGEC